EGEQRQQPLLHATIVTSFDKICMILKLKRTPGIYLVGFMGSGKSTVGQVLAAQLGWHFLDLDDEIERVQGATISEIFDQKGEPPSREVESAALRDCVRTIQRGRPQVVSLGGGAFLNPQNCDLLIHNGVTIWLDCPLDVIERRVGADGHRPLARDPERLRGLY